MLQDDYFNVENALMDFIESVKGSYAPYSLKEDLLIELSDSTSVDITLDECVDDVDFLLADIDEVLSSTDNPVEWKHYLLDKESLLTIFHKHYLESVA